MEKKYKIKTYGEFTKFVKKHKKIKFCKCNDEEFKKMMKPIMRDMCNRLFNSNINLKQLHIDESDYTWDFLSK